MPLSRRFIDDALEKLTGRLDVWMIFAPVFGELAFDSGSEDGGLVAFEVGLDALEIGDGFVEAGELFFNLRDDEHLLIRRCYWDFDVLGSASDQVNAVHTPLNSFVAFSRSKIIENPSRIDAAFGANPHKLTDYESVFVLSWDTENYSNFLSNVLRHVG